MRCYWTTRGRVGLRAPLQTNPFAVELKLWPPPSATILFESKNTSEKVQHLELLDLGDG